MFPIPFNFPFRKKDGSVITIADAISSGGGGGYELPTASTSTKGGIKIGNRLTMNGEVLSADAQVPAYTLSDNGKVLTVNDSGELEWDEKGSGGGNAYTEILFPVFKLYENDHYDITIALSPLNTSRDVAYRFTDSHIYTASDVYLPSEYSSYELYGVISSADITNFGLTLLDEELTSGVVSFTLNDSLDNYSAIFIQGCYDSSGSSGYDTTIIYVNPTTSTPYWFGMKDRNSSYSGTITFTDSTHGNVSYNTPRRFKIYGIPK